MTNSLISMTITDALKGLKDKKFSATELVTAHINQVNACDHLNAFITKTPELALKPQQSLMHVLPRAKCAYWKVFRLR